RAGRPCGWRPRPAARGPADGPRSIPAGDGSSTTAATGSHPGAGPITGNRLTPLETAVVYIDTPRRTRWFPTAAHQGSRRDFVRRVQAAAADAAPRGPP